MSHTNRYQGDIADKIGRRPTIIIGSGIFTIGCIFEIAASGQLAVFCIGRVIAGVGVGFISAIIILYISEIAPKAVRGALVSTSCEEFLHMNIS